MTSEDNRRQTKRDAILTVRLPTAKLNDIHLAATKEYLTASTLTLKALDEYLQRRKI